MRAKVLVILLLILAVAALLLMFSNLDQTPDWGSGGVDEPSPTINQPLGARDGILSLKVRAYPLSAVTPRKSEQTIYAIVQDQTLVPVKGAEVSLEVQMPSGEKHRYIFNNPTDENGITQTTFPFESEDVGMVLISVIASRDRIEAMTSTSFRIWYGSPPP